MAVEALTVGAADLAVQALIHICRRSRVRAPHPALGDVLFLSTVSYRLPSLGSWPLAFLPRRERPPLCTFGYSLMGVPCVVASPA